MPKRRVLRYKDNKLIEGLEDYQEKKEDEEEKRKSARVLSLVGEFGYSVSLPIVAGAILGNFLDGKFNSSPRITLSLIFFGIFIAVYNFYSLLKKLKD